MLTRTLFRRCKAPPYIDPYFNNVQLLVRGEGSIVDSSKNSRSLSISSATISQEQPKDGSNSIKFVSGSSISLPLNIANVDFCIDYWIMPTTNAVNTVPITNYHISYGQGGALVVYSGPSTMALYSSSGTSWPVTSANSVPINTWTHVAITHSVTSSETKIYINGVLNVTGTVVVNGGTRFFIGGSAGDNNLGTSWFVGFMKNIRVTTGILRYTEDFIPSAWS